MSEPLIDPLEVIDKLTPEQRQLFDESLYKPIFERKLKNGEIEVVSLLSGLLTKLRYEFPTIQEDDLEDAINDTISCLLRKSLKGELDFAPMITASNSGWHYALRGFAIRAACRRVLKRKRDRSRQYNNDSLDRLPDKIRKSPIDELATSERLVSVRERMLGLGSNQSRRFESHLNGITDQEIAEKDGMSTQAVKQERYRTRRELRSQHGDLDDS